MSRIKLRFTYPLFYAGGPGECDTSVRDGHYDHIDAVPLYELLPAVKTVIAAREEGGRRSLVDVEIGLPDKPDKITFFGRFLVLSQSAVHVVPSPPATLANGVPNTQVVEGVNS